MVVKQEYFVLSFEEVSECCTASYYTVITQRILTTCGTFPKIKSLYNQKLKCMDFNFT